MFCLSLRRYTEASPRDRAVAANAVYLVHYLTTTLRGTDPVIAVGLGGEEGAPGGGGGGGRGGRDNSPLVRIIPFLILPPLLNT